MKRRYYNMIEREYNRKIRDLTKNYNLNYDNDRIYSM
jgi:hypothetical protein